MEKDLTLVILAAGMGSRFGGLKQIEPVGPNGEFIIDYSIYDAIRAGFNKIVFIIKEENYELFRDTIGKRVEPFVSVSYVFQKLDDLPDGFEVPPLREKPWGTGHAIYATRNEVKGNFAMINSDDFYGRDAFNVLGLFCRDAHDSSFCMVGYKVANTMSKTSSVKRGVAYEKDGYLTKLIESSVSYVGDKIVAKPLSSDSEFEIKPDTLVSTNMFGFTDEIYSLLDAGLVSFLRDNINDLKSEYLIPDVIFNGIKNNLCSVKVLSTTSVWCGVTYKEDKESVVNSINKMIEEGIYPNNLWK